MSDELSTSRGTIGLRRAGPDDALCTGVLATQVFLDTYATNGISRELAREALDGYGPAFFARRLAQPDVVLWLAELDGHAVAFVELQSHRPCPVQGGPADLELVRLYVQQPFQGLGVGRGLLRLAEQHAHRQAAPRLWLTAWDGNTRARAFYSRCGWADVGATTHVIQGVGYANRVFVWPGTGPAAGQVAPPFL